MKWCLINGYDPNAQDASGFTPLMWLMRMHDNHTRARKRMFRLLVKYGADINLLDAAGEKAIDHAEHNANSTLYKYVRREYCRISG